MTKYAVYRTEKGTLTFKPQGEIVYTISSSTKLGAEECLKMLKNAEKQLKNTEE